MSKKIPFTEEQIRVLSRIPIIIPEVLRKADYDSQKNDGSYGR